MKWQPGRLVDVHPQLGDEKDISQEEIKALTRKVVRGRPAEPSLQVFMDYLAVGCKATKFYELHPDDVELVHGGATPFACEHEWITD